MGHFEPQDALAAIERYRVTDSHCARAHFVRKLKLPEEVRTRCDLSSLKRAIDVAAPCPEPVKRAMIKWWGPVIVEFGVGSGGIGMALIKSEDWLAHPGSVGKAIYGTLHVCGPDGTEVTAGEDGLIYFENQIMPTYHNDPEKTAEAMHPTGWMSRVNMPKRCECRAEQPREANGKLYKREGRDEFAARAEAGAAA